MLKEIKMHIDVLLSNKNMLKSLIGKNKFWDMLFSKIFLRINYPIYIDMGLYFVPWNRRKEYLLRDVQYALKYNPGVTRNNHDDKADLVSKIKPYLNRKIIFTQKINFETFVNFVSGLDSFFYKPVDGDGGHGIKKYKLENIDVENLFNEIKTLPNGILEETVKQHPKMNELCPTVLQTIRFTVFKHKNGPRLVSAFVRTTTNNKTIVDNACSGGIFADINVDTGCIQSNAFCILTAVHNIAAIDKRLTTDEGLDKHPITGTVFKGFQIPFFREAKDLVLEMADEVDFYNRRFLGFDIAISEKGPEVIEVNTTRPGIYVWQMMYKNKPLKSTIESILQE